MASLRSMLEYRFSAKRLPGPGTGNLAFMPFQTLPAYSPGGTGITYNRGMRAINEPQVYEKQAVVIDGINGITAGDIQLQGLQDMEEVLLSNLTPSASSFG